MQCKKRPIHFRYDFSSVSKPIFEVVLNHIKNKQLHHEGLIVCQNEKITLHKMQYNKTYLIESTAALTGLAINNFITPGLRRYASHPGLVNWQRLRRLF